MPTYEILDTYVVLFDLVHCYVRLFLVFTTRSVLDIVRDEHFLDFFGFSGKQPLKRRQCVCVESITSISHANTAAFFFVFSLTALCFRNCFFREAFLSSF